MSMLRRLIRGLTDIAFPGICLSCRRKLGSGGDEYICAACGSGIKRNLPPFCSSCGRHLEKNNLNKNICPGCLRKNLSFDRAYSPCLYEGIAKKLIHEFKYRGKDHLGKPLSKIMIDFIREYDLPVDYLDCIIPMPLHKTRLRERDFNQAEVLGRHIGAEFKKDLLTCLNRHRPTRTQTELPPQQRFANVKGSFSVAKGASLNKRNILLIDDVLTTGATSSAAAACLKEAGADIVFVLTLAS
ncbi:MAG: ComF family protein [Candidatus Omnitrophota bacterium]